MSCNEMKKGAGKYFLIVAGVIVGLVILVGIIFSLMDKEVLLGPLIDGKLGVNGMGSLEKSGRESDLPNIEPFDEVAKQERIDLILSDGEPVEKIGVLETIILDDFENQRAENYFYLNVDGERYGIYNADEKLLRIGYNTQLKIVGNKLEGEIVAFSINTIENEDGISLSPDSDFGEQRTAAILVNFLNDQSTPFTSEAVYHNVFDEEIQGSVASYYREASYNKVWITGETLGWINLDYSDENCLVWTPQGEQDLIEALDPYIDYNLFDRLVIYFPKNINCHFNGRSSFGRTFHETQEGTVNLAIALINSNSLSGSLVAHEMGHGFGLSHANYYECGDEIISNFCSSIYTDKYDVMGQVSLFASGFGHFNGPHKDQLGWFNSNNVLIVDYPGGTYQISPLEDHSEDTQIIKVPVEYYINPYYGSTAYYLEYRKNIGHDSLFPQLEEDGLMIHLDKKDLWTHQTYSDTQLLDMSPIFEDSQLIYGDVLLKVGEIFHDIENGIFISPMIPVEGGKLSVNIEFSGGCGNGIVDNSIGEECDGNNFDGNSCISLGFVGGNLGCNNLCTFDLAGCSGSICGEGHTYNGDGTCTAKIISDFEDHSLWASGPWASVRSASIGRYNYGENSNLFLNFRDATTNKSWIYRVSLPFDTSSIPDSSNILSAEMRLYVAEGAEPYGNSHPNSKDYMALVQTNLENPPFLNLGDFDQFGSLNNPLELSQRIDLSEEFELSSPITFILNGEGMNRINKNGWTTLGLRGGYDVENYYFPNEDTDLRASIYSSDSPIFGPLLNIVYSSSGGCGNSILESGEQCDPPGSSQSCTPRTPGGGLEPQPINYMERLAVNGTGTQICSTSCAWGSCVSNPVCGDNICNGNETCSSCSGDCGNCSGGGGSFIPGTEITMGYESKKKIEEVKIGDEVLSYDENRKRNVISRVSGVFSHVMPGYYVLDDELKITATNPIFVNGEWSYPPKLKIGDKLLTAEGKEKKIESIKYAEGEVKVYNLQVEKTKNYFAEDVLVHNKDDQTGKYVGI